MQLTGIFAALTTPFDDAGELLLDRLASNLASYNATDLAGYLVLGSSGEAIYLNQEEKLAVLRQAVDAAAPGKVLLAGTAEESLRGTLDMTARAAAFGYHAAVVRTPHYYKKSMTPAAFRAFYRELADQAALPIVMYNIPPLTGVDLGLDTTLQLAGHPNIVGLKESSGSMDKLVRLMAARKPDFAVLVGGASTLYPSLCAGASGAILALAAAAPEACCAVEAAFRRGDHAGALQAQRQLLAPCGAFEPVGIAGLKAAVATGGRYGGPPRLPQLPLGTEAQQAIAAAFACLRPACGSAA